MDMRMRPSRKDIEKITKIFRPSAPIEDPEMFVGREDQKQLLHRALLAPGRHIALFGQRGVGKTSLLNIVTSELEGQKSGPIIKYTCSHRDTYDDVFRKFLACTNQLFQQQTTRKKTVRNLESKIKIPIAEGGLQSSSEEESTVLPVFARSATPDTIATHYCTRPPYF
jgi:predicted KAP-like P-loop ATPase